MGHEEADECRAQLTEPLQTARDHAHWLAVHRRRFHKGTTAGHLENVLNAALRMAYDLEGQLARAKEPS